MFMPFRALIWGTSACFRGPRLEKLSIISKVSCFQGVLPGMSYCLQELETSLLQALKERICDLTGKSGKSLELALGLPACRIAVPALP